MGREDCIRGTMGEELYVGKAFELLCCLYFCDRFHVLALYMFMCFHSS